jgi:prevent-host-death family protein
MWPQKEEKMISVGIKEIKDNLSRYLSSVKQGEEVVITERGRPIARIIKEGPTKKSIRSALSQLVQQGSITLPSTTTDWGTTPSPTVTLNGKPISDMVVEDRR